MSETSTSEQTINGPKCIEIPRGWSRILENGAILYISPNNSRLRSLDHVIEYLKTEGTCKCGLECPFFIHKVFNFDARIPSKLIPVNSRQEPSQSGCKHYTLDYLDVQQPSEIAAKQANDVKLPPFSTLAQKRGPGRPRNPLAKSRRVSVQKPDVDRPTSPLHNIPLPVPSSIVNSPVQSVPTNIAVEQGPLPSFATIVSSSKLFNSGAGLGSTLLTSSTVTSVVSSSPLTATTSQSSKTITVTSNASVSLSAPCNSLASTGQVVTEASKPTVSVAGTAAMISVTLPSKNPPGVTLTKCPSTSSVSTTSTTLTTLAPSSTDPLKDTTSVTSTTTSVVSTSVTTIPITKQDVKLVANVGKLPSVKMSTKVAAPRQSKPTKSYGPRKTVASTLKAAAASKVLAVSSEATRAGLNSPLQRTQVAATTAAVASSVKGTASSASKTSSQVLPTSFVSTTVQAPALFHSVLKDPIIRGEGRAVSSPSTTVTTVTGTDTVHATPSHMKGTQPVSSASARNKSAVSKEITQATTALAQSVKTSHATPTVPQHVPAHRAQPPVTGYSLANTAGGLGGQVSMPSSTSQQQIVQAASVAQSPAQITSSASAYGQVQNTVGSSQVPSLQVAASQAQGGVFFQGNGNQVFQMNVDPSQLKGAYQLHGALYQGAIPATFIATANGNKAASPNTPGGIPQAMYPTNPYMLGIVMPTAVTQSNQSGQAVPTTATSPSATAAAAAAAISVASYSYNNQNAAIAAAFDSFVPIAPAASPRFSQTLAHLASAYTPFLPRGAIPANAPVQFAAQRMVPMTAIQSQTGGNGQMGPTVLNLGDYAVKYPLNTVKPGSYNSQPSTSSNAGPANTHPQTAVVAAMPYVAFGQINHPRFPFSVNFATPSVSTGPSVTSSSASPACSFVTSATTPHQYGAGTNIDSHATSAVLGYVTMPFNTNHTGTGHSLSSPNPHPGSAFSPPSSHGIASHGNQKMDIQGPAHHLPPWVATKSLSGATNKRRCSTPDNSSSVCCSVQNSCSSFSVSSSRSSCMEVSASSATALRTSSSSSSGQSPRHSSVTSPLNSPLPMSSQGLPGCRGSPKADSPLASNKGSVDSMPSRVQSFNVVESHPVKTSSEMACTLKRTYSDNNEQTKKTKYNESAYYETNPLLGLKRSCEAIEAYCSPERDDDDDDEDDEDDYIDDPSASKNEGSSPENNQSGEEIPNSKKCSKLNSCNESDDRSRGNPNSRDERAVSGENEPISNKRQSHSLYNGDVSPSQNEPARVQMVNQGSYLPVKTNPVTSNNQECLTEPPVSITRPQFDIGDIVWAQARGLPSWPGKVVDASEVGKARPDDGKRWVMWFGDHTFSQVEVDRLKTLSDGLRTLDDKARKKKYKAKKARIGLEQAISEALEALELRERLRGRQAARSKAKKKRIR